MQVDITLKNYRCFPDHKPARISLRRGFTAFVGANNSGKSSMLKFFYEFRGFFEQLAQQSVFYDVLRGREHVFDFMSSVRDPAEVFCNTTSRDLGIEFQFTIERRMTAPRSQVSKVPACLVVTVPRNTHRWEASFYLDNELLPPEEVALNVAFQGSELHRNGKSQGDMGGFFRFLKALSKALYIGAFRNAINIGSTVDYFDIQVGQAFVQAWRQYKTGDRKRDNEAAIRLTKDISGIFGFEELEISPSADDQTLQIMINGKSYRLNELGSGLAQFIIVLANAAIKRPSYILIDEPELNLHPSLQLDFLTTLASYAEEGILFATHSIGLGRACADQVYSFRKIAEGGSEVVPYEATPHLSEFLGELSFSGYQALGFEKILLVEGSTEVKTIQQFLRKYGKDHQIVLLPLGGSDLIKASCEAELQEVKRITDQVYALIDSERAAPDAPLPPDREGFVQACEDVGIECHLLDYRAIESYFSDRAVQAVKGDEYRAPKSFEKLSELENGWAKSENWRIAREMTLEELEGTDLGEFLAGL